MLFYRNKSKSKRMKYQNPGVLRQLISSTKLFSVNQLIDLGWTDQKKWRVTFGWKMWTGNALLIKSTRPHLNLMSDHRWKSRVWINIPPKRWKRISLCWDETQSSRSSRATNTTLSSFVTRWSKKRERRSSRAASA